MKFTILLACLTICSCGGRHGDRFLRVPTPIVAGPPAPTDSDFAKPPSRESREATPPIEPAAVATATGNTGADRVIRQQVEIIDGMLGDAYFDYDQYRLRADAVDALREAARLLAKALETQPGARLLVEGHCDERGSSPYNLALGDARAQKVREFLGDVGLPASRIDTVSYGEDRPECTDSTEACWQRNRRAHLRYSNPTP